MGLNPMDTYYILSTGSEYTLDVSDDFLTEW